MGDSNSKQLVESLDRRAVQLLEGTQRSMSQKLWRRSGDGTFKVAMPADCGGLLAKFHDLCQWLTEMWFGPAHKLKLPRNTQSQTDIHPLLIRGKWVSQDAAELRTIMKDVARRDEEDDLSFGNKITCPPFSEQDTL